MSQGLSMSPRLAQQSPDLRVLLLPAPSSAEAKWRICGFRRRSQLRGSDGFAPSSWGWPPLGLSPAQANLYSVVGVPYQIKLPVSRKNLPLISKFYLKQCKFEQIIAKNLYNSLGNVSRETFPRGALSFRQILPGRHRIADMLGRGVQRRQLLFVQVEFHDLLHPTRAQPTGDAQE